MLDTYSNGLIPPTQENIVWQFLPGTGQELALSIPTVNEMLLCGGRGWGKTDVQLMRFRKHVNLGYGTHWRGIIFDREYKNLDDLVVKSRRLFGDFDKGHADFLSSNSSYKWVWDTGEELLFRVAKKETDYWPYHGHEYPFVGWNELTKYATAALYNRMRSVNRSGFDPITHTPRLRGNNYVEHWNYLHPAGHYEGRPFREGDYETSDGRPLPPIPLEIVSTTNPFGAGHNWVKSDFIDVQEDYGQVVTKERLVFNPKTQKEELVTRRQVAIFGTFRENPFLSPEYISGLYEDNDENVVKAWVDGDWNIVAGGAFDDVWRKNVHVLPRFKVPHSWHVDRSLDWGSSHPCSVGWWAEANGEEVEFTDRLGRRRVFCPPRGTLIQIGELYFTKKIGSNVGLKKTATEVATAIIEYENRLLAGGWVSGPIWGGPADNQISDVRESDVDTVEQKMAKQGVRWEKSIKSAGSRKIGFELMRDRYSAAKKGTTEPGLYHMENCLASIATIPVLPRDEDDTEDVDTSAEDHPYDMTRYRVLKSGMRMAKKLKVSLPH